MTQQVEQEFAFLGHRILVPRSVLESWAALSADKVCRILNSVWVVYMKENLKWGCAQVGPKVVAEELASGKAALSGPQLWHACLKQGRSPRKKLRRSPRRKLTGAEVKERVLWLLQFQGYRDWNRSPIAAAFWRAIEWAFVRGDQDFFIKLGKRLKEKPIPFKRPRSFSPLADLLLEHWVANEGICLCWFSNNALKDFLEQIGKSYTPDTIRKAYDRLGLRKLRRPLVLGSEVVGKQIIRLRGSGTN